MARSNGNDNVVFVKLHEMRTKKPNGEEVRKLVFTERIKDDTGYIDGENFDTIDGVLKKVSLFQYEYPKESGIMIDGLELHIKDGEEMQIVKGNFNFATRQLLNKLIWAVNESQVGVSDATIEISLKTDSEENHSVFVTIDGERCKQMYSYQQLPKRREYQGKGGKTEYDDAPLNDFFKNATQMFVFPQFEEKKEQEQVQNRNTEINDNLPF